MPIGKRYLGDSVYVVCADGYGLLLTTENGRPDDPSNQIYLEPEVWKALVSFVQTLQEANEVIRDQGG